MTIAPLQSRLLTLRSKLENLIEVEGLINQIFDEGDINQDYYGNMLVALSEAVNNAITHGNRMDEEKKVEISFNQDKGKLKFFIKDEGEGFDYMNLPDPTSPENLEKPEGRGIFLMKNLADDVAFFDNGSRVQLIFNTY